MRNTVSILLIVVLAILTPVLFVVASARFNVLTTSSLKREFARFDLYGLALGQLDGQVRKIVIDPQYPVTHDEVIELAHRVVSEPWLRGNVEGHLDRADAWLDAPQGTPLILPVDLREPKLQLTAGIDSLLDTKLEQLQPCPDRRRPKEEQGICQFAGLSVPQVKEQLGHMGLQPDLIGQLLPDTLDLMNPDLSSVLGEASGTDPESAAEKTAAMQKNLDRFKARYQQVVFLLNLALAIVMIVAVLYLALNAMAGWRRLVRWGGALLFIVGLSPLTLALVSGPVVEELVIAKVRLSSAIPAELASLVPQLIRDTREALFTPLLVIGVGFVCLGLAGLIGGHWLPTSLSAKTKS